MISDQYRCIFVEVPKTGSTSIRSVIGFPKKPHLNIWQIAGQIPKEKFESYYKFGFVRNSWDRAVSLYERKEGVQMKSKITFDEFIEWMKLSSCTSIYPVPHRYQIDWFLNPHGDVIVDFIGKFENLKNDWTVIANKINANPNLPQKNMNSNREQHYSEYYSEKTRKIVADRFAVDIEYFDYSFEE